MLECTDCPYYSAAERWGWRRVWLSWFVHTLFPDLPWEPDTPVEGREADNKGRG